MNTFLLVGLGGFLGAISRFLVTKFIRSRYAKVFPLETFIINVSGSFLLGFIVGHRQFGPEIFFLFGAGFMGAYTTFSTFELEAVELIRKNKLFISLLYLFLSVIAGVFAAYLGYLLGNSSV